MTVLRTVCTYARISINFFLLSLLYLRLLILKRRNQPRLPSVRPSGPPGSRRISANAAIVVQHITLHIDGEIERGRTIINLTIV